MSGQTQGSMSGVVVGSCGEVRVSGGKGKGELAVYPGCNPFDLYKEYSSLNPGQKEAVRKVLYAQDYALLLGLPGTGKTSTLSLITRALIARNQKVLICSYTHSAVDNLLVKIAEAGVNSAMALRIGYSASVDPSMRRCVLEVANPYSKYIHYLERSFLEDATKSHHSIVVYIKQLEQRM